MKKTINSFIIILLIIVTHSSLAQDRELSVGPAPILGGGTVHSIINALDNPASIAYGHEYQSRSTLSMPIPAGTPFNTLSIFNPSDFATSMTKGGNGNYYIITREPALYQFNNNSGAVTLLGYISGLEVDDLPNGITFNPADSNYYLITGKNLYTFNITTRVATLVGNMGISNSAFIDLCFNEAGACYAYDIQTDAAYIINPQTGAATLLGPLGYPANYGQGMSYDMETGTIYLSAYNFGTTTGQLRIMNPGTGATTLVTDWGISQIAPFALNTVYPSPCTIGSPINPNPANDSSGLPVSGITAAWTNGVGTVDVEVWFGSVGDVAKIYDGPAINSFSLPDLNYSSKYLWWVVCKNSTCKTQGLPWTFTTEMDPNAVIAFYEPFNSPNCWTPIGPVGLGNWSLSPTNNAGGSPPTELDLFYDPTFNGLSRIISCPINTSNLYVNTISWRHYFDLYAAADPYIGLAVTYDGGTTSNVLWEVRSQEDILAEQKSVTFAPASSTYQIIFYLNGNSFNINQWDIDDIRVEYIVPVELSSFTAVVNEGIVELNWLTSTETNNRGFEVQRNNGGDFETIAFIDGNGTTTDKHAYSYSDENVNAGSYNYRLKQIDFDGTIKYSNIVEVDIPVLKEFALDQNYPNPFNPNTKIEFRLAVDSKVNLKVFDILGQEVATLVNTNMVSGAHNVDFNASSLNSGVYFYRIEATGIDGTNFLNVKKMSILK